MKTLQDLITEYERDEIFYYEEAERCRKHKDYENDTRWNDKGNILSRVITDLKKLNMDAVKRDQVCDCKEHRKVPFSLKPYLKCTICGLPLIEQT